MGTPVEQKEEKMTNNRIKAAVDSGDVPRLLYKYRHLYNKDSLKINENTEALILKGTYYFPTPNQLNDPYEFRIKDLGIYTLHDVIHYLEYNTCPVSHSEAVKLANSLPDIGNFVSNELEKAKEKKAKTIGVYCLTENPKNILMWCHYADEHRGCVLGIDITKLPDDSYYPLKVTYEKDYPSIEYLKNREFLKKWALTKAEDWEYEQERRILKNNSFGVINLPPEAVVEVIFGCKAEPSVVTDMKNLIASCCLTPVFKTAELSHSSYELILK